MSKMFAQAMADAVYAGSADPEHPDNNSQDWQDGYVVGLLRGNADNSGKHDIPTEYQRRGCPEDEDGLASFKEWKRGYWAGVLTALNE